MKTGRPARSAVRPLQTETKRDEKEGACGRPIRRCGAVLQPYRAPSHTAAFDAANQDAATSQQSQPGTARKESPTPLRRDGCANPAPADAYLLPVRQPTAAANPRSEERRV